MCQCSCLLSLLTLCFFVLAYGGVPVATNHNLSQNPKQSVDASKTVRDFGRFGSYIKLPNTKNTSMFYYFFKSRKNDANAPFVVYLSGGPGCSGSVGVFYLNGPFRLTKNSTLVWNDLGLDKESNIIYVDQPTGTGFSYSTSQHDIRHTSEEAGVDFYYFLQAFFEKHSEYATNDLYILGGSYAGHYIPAFANRIQKENRKNHAQSIHINLKGIAMVSAWTYPGLQFSAYPRYALNMKLITQAQFENRTIAERLSWCRQRVQTFCDNDTSYNFTACGKANDDCNNILLDYLVKPMGDNTSVYDIRKKCKEGYFCNNDFSGMERFLNLSSVKKALGVDSSMRFSTCSSKVYEEMSGDQMRNVADYVPRLLKDGIKLLVYGGEFDFICNWQGNLLWVTKMRWWGRRGFRLASTVAFEADDGAEAGVMKSYGPLTFLTVKDAGHLVMMDQPKVSFQILTRWIKRNIS